MKKAGSKLLAASITVVTAVLQVFGTPQPIHAFENEKVVNSCTSVGSFQAKMLYDMISKSIVNKYEGIYDFDNLQITISNQRTEKGSVVVDVDATADMTLIKSPKDSQYVKGMEEAIEDLTDQAEILLAQNRYEAYLDQVMPCYNETVQIGFEYQVNIPNNTATRSVTEDEIELYHRIDTEDGAILTKVEMDDKYTEDENYLAGKEDIARYVENTKENEYAARAVSFSRANAVAYAVAHAMDEPEYAGNGNSDCANFVSKCINAGGIPEDKAGKWFRASTPGGLDAGKHWIRTGYNNGGVVPYMTGKGYYALVSYAWQSTLASIMYWNTKSHVAFVTRIDGYNILYSHHSNVPKGSTYYLYNSATDNVTFYVPQI